MQAVEAVKGLIEIEAWCWFAEAEDGVLRIEKALKVPDEDIQHLLVHAKGLELISDEDVVDHWFLEQKARVRQWRMM